MKFDVIVGNPPYDGNGAKNVKLWAKFALRMIELNPTVLAFITPNNIISDIGINGKNLRNQITNSGFNFIYAEDHGDKWFNDVSVATCHWIISRDSDKRRIDPILIKTNIERSPLVDGIINKVLDTTKKLSLTVANGNILRSDLLPAGVAKNPIYFSGDKLHSTSKELEVKGGLKVIFPFSSSYHKMFISEIGTGMLNAFFEIKSEHEGRVIISYANSKLFNFVARNYKKTAGFTPLIKKSMLPDLRREELWTDTELYEFFNLTDEEIALIAKAK
jgi:hypothetical protein